MVAIVVVTFLLSLLAPPRVFTLGVWCFSGFASLSPLVFAALYWKRRLTAAGAYASVIVTAVTWVWLFREADYAMNPMYTYLDMMPVATMITCSTVALVVVSLITPPPSRQTVERFFPAE